MEVNEIVELKAQKLTYGLDCLAYTDDKPVVFLKNAVVGDVVKARIVSVNKNFLRAETVEIIQPSPYRTKPLCPIFNACGSCQFQSWDYNFLLEQKNIVLKDIFQSVIDENKIYPIAKSPEIKGYRHKIQYPCRQTKNSKRILMGYFKNGTHDITNIKFCPIQPQIADKIAQYIRENYILGCYDEKKHKGLLKNVLMRVSTKDEVLLTFVLNSDENNFNLNLKNYFVEFFLRLCIEIPSIKGCFVNFNPTKANKILGEKSCKIAGDDYITENLGDRVYRIGFESFFQVNPRAAKVLFDIIKDNIKEGSNVLDAYSGVGAIGIYISEKASSVTFVEENENAVLMARENIKLNNIQNAQVFSGDAKKVLKSFCDNKAFDYAILDPPRAGVDREGLDAISKIADNIVYVSCNPQTLRRDMIYLLDKGYDVEFLRPLDMFPYTYHIESVVAFKKK